MYKSDAVYCVFIWLCRGVGINEKEQGNSLNYKGERGRKLAQLHSSWMQKCYTIINSMKGNMHNYSLHRTGNKWKGWLWQGRKQREIWETGHSAFQIQEDFLCKQCPGWTCQLCVWQSRKQMHWLKCWIHPQTQIQLTRKRGASVDGNLAFWCKQCRDRWHTWCS